MTPSPAASPVPPRTGEAAPPTLPTPTPTPPPRAATTPLAHPTAVSPPTSPHPPSPTPPARARTDPSEHPAAASSGPTARRLGQCEPLTTPDPHPPTTPSSGARIPLVEHPTAVSSDGDTHPPAPTPPLRAGEDGFGHGVAGSFDEAWGKVEATLDRAGAVSPRAAARARERLRRVLAPVAASEWPEIAGRFSRLTTTKHPVELAWTSRDTGLRWTAEVAPPEVANDRRLLLAAALAGLDPALTSTIVELQAGAPLRWGAWLSGRHEEPEPAATRSAGVVGASAERTMTASAKPSAAGLTASSPAATSDAGLDRAKVYAELPPGARLQTLVDHPVLRSAGMRWRMVGANPDGSVELYGGLDRPDEADLLAFEQATLGSSGRLLRAVRALTGAPELARPSGLSVVFAPSGRPLALTWFAQATALFADDAATVEALVRATPDPVPAALLRALAAGGGPRRHVVPVGVGIAVDDSTWVQAGVLPH